MTDSVIANDAAAPEGPGGGRRGVLTAAVLGAAGLGVAGVAKALSMGSSTSDAAATATGTARSVTTPKATSAAAATPSTASPSASVSASSAVPSNAVQTADRVDINDSYARTTRRTGATTEHLTYPDIVVTPRRGDIALRGTTTGAMGLDRGFVVTPALAALKSSITGGTFAAVPAISTPNLSRSHFQAQDCLERGGASGGGTTDGWLDRLLQVLGPGTTFRSIGAGYDTPRSLLGQGSPVVMDSLGSFDIQAIWSADVKKRTMTALKTLYTGFDHPMASTALTALVAADTVAKVNAAEATPAARGYADNEFGNALAALGSLIRTGQGVRVATVDLGGWDMHTNIGSPLGGDFTTLASGLGSGLATFLKDLGTAAATTTIVVMTEFGRRVEANASAGVDHGHGGVALVLGGGVSGGLKGTWDDNWYSSQDYLDTGDIPGTNDYRDLLAEVVMKRFGLTAAQITPVFPDWTPKPLGVMV